MEKPFVLKIDEFMVKKGSLIGVIGTIGAGKSSLILAIINEMTKTKGSIEVDGKITIIT